MPESAELSPELTSLIAGITAALNSRDKDAWDAGVCPDVIADPVPGWPEPGPFVGADAAWDFFQGIEKAFLEVGPSEIVKVTPGGDGVVIVIRRLIRLEGGEPTPVDVHMAATFRDGKFASMRSFYDPESARESLGV